MASKKKKAEPDKILVPDGPRLYKEIALAASAYSGDWYVCSDCPQKAGDEIAMCSCLEILMFGHVGGANGE